MGFFCKLLGEWCVRTRLTEATVRTRGGICDEDEENSFWCDGWDVRCPGGLGARGDRARTCAGAWQHHVSDVGHAACAAGVPNVGNVMLPSSRARAGAVPASA